MREVVRAGTAAHGEVVAASATASANDDAASTPTARRRSPYLMPLAIFWRTQDPWVGAVFVTLSAILIWRHKSNIERLIRGTES